MRFAVLKTTEMYFKDKPGNYIRMDFFDGENVVEAIQWAPQKELDYSDLIGKIVEAKGVPSTYKGKAQFKVDFIKTEDNLSDEEIAQFVRSSKRDRASMAKELFEYINLIVDSDLKGFVGYIFEKKEVAERFFDISAATEKHHAYRFGLLEHTLETVQCAVSLFSITKLGNKDLILAGALLHDIGKIYEYSLEGVSFVRTEVGKEQGHISIGNSMICRYYEKYATEQGIFLPDMRIEESSEELVERAFNFKSLIQDLKHIILSHHGTNEWGSPVVPQTVEAVIVHHADLSPVRVLQMNMDIEKRDGTVKLKEDRKKDLSIPFI